MKKATWIVDKYLLEGTLSENLPNVIRECGFECKETAYVPFSESNEWSGPCVDMGPVVLYGTHGFIKQTRQAHLPGAYCNEDNLRFSAYSARYHKDWPLNSLDFARFLTWAHIKNMGSQFPDWFIRPDAVTKSFSGQVVNSEDWDKWVETMDQVSSISDNSWCVMAPVREITAEYRFFIVDGKVITGSQYRRDGRLDIRIDVSEGAQFLAEDVAAHKWQPDSAFVVDIAQNSSGRCTIIELNSFSCAGMYACDQHKIVNAVSELALRDYLTEMGESPKT